MSKISNLIDKHFYKDGIICCPYYENNAIIDVLLLLAKEMKG